MNPHPAASETRILSAVRSPGAFRTVKQPILRLADQSVVAYEFLSRCTLPGAEMPADFLGFCMERGLLTPVDLCCLATCARAARRQPPDLRRHVNIYPATLAEVPLRDLLELFPPDGSEGIFCLEINETVRPDDLPRLVPKVEVLKESGLLVAIDDIGFGNSSLESLLALEPDVLKIDRRLVTGAGADPGRRRLLRRLARIAESLGTQAVAEGIETAEDLALALELGIPFGQGYLWGKPA